MWKASIGVLMGKSPSCRSFSGTMCLQEARHRNRNWLLPTLNSSAAAALGGSSSAQASRTKSEKSSFARQTAQVTSHSPSINRGRWETVSSRDHNCAKRLRLRPWCPRRKISPEGMEAIRVFHSQVECLQQSHNFRGLSLTPHKSGTFSKYLPRRSNES
jgi:hypothetical protein